MMALNHMHSPSTCHVMVHSTVLGNHENEGSTFTVAGYYSIY